MRVRNDVANGIVAAAEHEIHKGIANAIRRYDPRIPEHEAMRISRQIDLTKEIDQVFAVSLPSP